MGKKFSNAGVKVGDVFYSSWGYDQTNIDFYKVVKKVGKTMVEIVEVGSSLVKSSGWAGGVVVADPDKVVGEPMKKKVGLSSWNDYKVPSIKIYSFAWAKPWDGSPKTYTSYA